MPKHFYWLSLAIVIFISDQVTKYYALLKLSYTEPLVIAPILNLVLTHNYGASWGFLNNPDGWQRWFFILIAFIIGGVILNWLYRLPPKDNWMAIALSLILGGALGNVWDRLYYGYVIDFIQFHWHDWYFPNFNIADTAITIGAMMLIIQMIFSKDEVQHSKLEERKP